MNSQDYIKTMIQNNGRIYIDTATLMEVEWMKLFIINCEEIIIKEKKKIIVPKAVCLELAKHIESADARKSHAALEAIGILSQNQNLFDVQNEAMTEQEIVKVFADCQILSELTLNKRDGGQLLITNDRKLSRDAYNLNELESYKGYRIMVCYLNKYGELHMCQCVKDTIFKEIPDEQKTVESPNVKNQRTIEKSVDNKARTNNIWGTLALLAISFTAGIIADEIYHGRGCA